MASMSMRQMLEAGVHFGHQTRFWNPKMAPFIFGDRNRIHIINLEKTLPLYAEAAGFVKSLVADGGKVLFVGTKRSARDAIAKEATRCGMPHVSHRWLGGMLTNFKTIRQSIRRLGEIDEMLANGVLEGRSKREAQTLRREHPELEAPGPVERHEAGHRADEHHPLEPEVEHAGALGDHLADRREHERRPRGHRDCKRRHPHGVHRVSLTSGARSDRGLKRTR